VLVLFEGLPPGSDEFMVCLMTQAALSPREREVAMLVARGFSNREVAARLSISPATVNVHLMKAFGKLDVPDRHGLTSLLLTGARKG
jgi:DNA-binding CsgD family transcriptional regulator